MCDVAAVKYRKDSIVHEGSITPAHRAKTLVVLENLTPELGICLAFQADYMGLRIGWHGLISPMVFV